MISAECTEECGIAGVMTSPDGDAAPLATLIAARLQHRGQEGGGIGVKKYQGGFDHRKDCGRFGLIFPSVGVLNRLGRDGLPLRGQIALGHTRYRTHGPENLICYAQPMEVYHQGRGLMGGHNGNIANVDLLHDELKSHGISLDTENQFNEEGKLLAVSDSEVLFRRILVASGVDWVERCRRGIEGVEGSFSLVMATDKDEMIAVRDPYGIRPLSFGRLNGYWIVSSETHVMDMIGAVDQNEIQKGTMWVFRANQDPEEIVYDNSKPWKRCDFEDWYFSWPSSYRNGIGISDIRRACGYQLGLEEKRFNRRVDADVVVCAPDSARVGAMPFARVVGIPYEEMIYKERYDGKGDRTFIASDELLRRRMLDQKYHYDRSLKGKRGYLIDDTGVRLTTIEIMGKALRQLGMSEIHVRLLAPKFIRPCVFGTNINNREELGAVEYRDGYWNTRSDDDIAKRIGLDSIAFLTMEGRRRVHEQLGEDPTGFCGYCHGDKGPNFNMETYDPHLKLEASYLAAV